MATSRTSPQVPSAYEVLAVLQYIGTQVGPVQASTIAREVGLPRSTTYHLLTALVREGFVTHLPEEHRYALGAVAYELGTGYARQVPLQRIAQHPISTLVKRSRNTAHLSVMHGHEVIYIIEHRAPRQPSLVTDKDVRLPAHLTASGRAMMAWMTPAQVSAIYADRPILARRQERGPTSVPELIDLLHRMRQTGYAWEAEEVTKGLYSIAAPVLDRANHPVASVALTVPAHTLIQQEGPSLKGHSAPVSPRHPQLQIELLGQRYAAQVTECAQELARRLGAARAGS
ncbi:IclR family transcriptional regulator [Specibacter cremeus]|uniref:IclR family transcriptional regulator n=1 Tax=Specibacter cremeus TaxID=1629051 RepID=UPI000F7B42DF|nr:IclR family transcriptional regulator [Specibacter cremeus]